MRDETSRNVDATAETREDVMIDVARSAGGYIATMTCVLLAGATVFLAPGEVLSASPRSLSGVVQTGGTTSREPLPHVNVTLFEATAARPTVLGSATTNASGHFTINSPHDTSSSIFYVSADIGAGVEFVAVLGPDLPAAVTINELTTVAAG